MTPAHVCTLREVAAAAGVSLAAASFALRGSGRVSPATAAHVRATADRLGYRSDQRVSEIMRRVRQDRGATYRETISVLDTGAERGRWRKPAANRRYAEGMRARAAQFGYGFEEFWLRAPRMTDARMEQILRTRGIRGLIVPPMSDPGLTIEFDWSQFATLAIGPSFNLPVNRVGNHRSAVPLAIERLRTLGYRRIGFVMQRHPVSAVEEFWCSGVHAYAAGIAAAERVPLLLYHEENRARDLAAWYRQHRPDAVLVHTLDEIEMLAAAGLDAGRNGGVATLNWESELEQLAGIDQRPTLMGATAVDLLMGQLSRNDLGLPEAPQEIMVGCVWRDGPSAPARSALQDRERSVA